MKKFSNWSIWLIDEILTDNTNLGQSEPGSDGNEYSTQFQNWSLTTNCSLVSYSQYTPLGWEILPLCRRFSWYILCVDSAPHPLIWKQTATAIHSLIHLIHNFNPCFFLLPLAAWADQSLLDVFKSNFNQSIQKDLCSDFNPDIKHCRKNKNIWCIYFTLQIYPKIIQ